MVKIEPQWGEIFIKEHPRFYAFVISQDIIVTCFTVAINELLCMKNASAQIAMDIR